MDRKLDEALCAKYPELFIQRHGDMRETAMCWGFECGDGWYPLIDTLCYHLMHPVISLRGQIKHFERVLLRTDKLTEFLKKTYTPEKLQEYKERLEGAVKNVPVVLQVKEKFGGLRFYTTGTTEEQGNYIHFAEGLSYKVCEECGSMKDTVLYSFGWNKTLCPSHADERYGDTAKHFRDKTGEFSYDE